MENKNYPIGLHRWKNPDGEIELIEDWLMDYKQQVKAEAIKPFEDLYNHHICLDYDFPTMKMLMDFYVRFTKVLKEVQNK